MTDAERKLQERIAANKTAIEKMMTDDLDEMMLTAGKTIDAGVKLASQCESDSDRLSVTNVLLIGLCQCVSAMMVMLYEKRE